MLYKDPGETLDYTVDWSRWLPPGDQIVASEWQVPLGLTEAHDATMAPTSATVWLSGGDDGSRYVLVNRITTAGGRIAERNVVLMIRDR